jgi:transposase-like protein
METHSVVTNIARKCPNCSRSIRGEQKGKNKDWHAYVCAPCQETWGEDVRYCLGSGFSTGQESL